jgi:acetolactate decarboxylase
MFEESMIRSLHVDAMSADEVASHHDHGALFQSSTIAALLEGRFDGDMTFGELAREGDTGLGTLNALDGEMIALDGRFYRADHRGEVTEIPPAEKTPFAVVVEFDPDIEVELAGISGFDALGTELDSAIGDCGPVVAIRIDGFFERVKARSVPRQEKPYRPLVEVVADQAVFEHGPCEGTLVGFRFPDWSEGIEVAGYHLHFIDTERTRGGHVLDLELKTGLARIESSSDLHVELPPGVELGPAGAASGTHEAIEQAETDRLSS